MSSRTCPDWPTLMELAPAAPVQALHAARSAASGGRPRFARAASTSTPSRSAATSTATSSTPSTPIRRRRGAPRLALVRAARVGGATAGRDAAEPASTPRARGRVRPALRRAVVSRRDAVASGSLPRREGQEPARAASRGGAGGARAGDARRRASTPAPAVGPTFVVAPERARRCAGATVVPDPGGGQGAAVRAGLDAAALASGGAGPFLVVNADLPCVTPRDLLALAGRRARRGARARGRGRRHHERARARLARALRAALRARQRRTLRRARRRRAASRRRTSSTTSTRSPTSSGCATRLGPQHARRARLAAARRGRVNVVALSGGVGGARFLRGLVELVERPTSSRSSATSATTSRCSGCTSRPISTASSTRSPGSPTRSAAGGAPRRPGTRSRPSRELGGESWFRLGDRDIGLHLVRTALLRAGPAALGGHGAARRGASGRRVALLPATDDPLRTFVETPAGTFAFQEWFVARGHRDPVDAVALRGRARRARRPRACSSALEQRRPDRDRAQQPLRLDPADPRRRGDPARARAPHACPAIAVSPLIGGRAVKGPADAMLARLAGDTTPGRRRRLLPGADRRARHRRERRPGRAAGRGRGRRRRGR